MRTRGLPNCGHFRSNETAVSIAFDAEYLFRYERKRERENLRIVSQMHISWNKPNRLPVRCQLKRRQSRNFALDTSNASPPFAQQIIGLYSHRLTYNLGLGCSKEIEHRAHNIKYDRSIIHENINFKQTKESYAFSTVDVNSNNN